MIIYLNLFFVFLCDIKGLFCHINHQHQKIADNKAIPIYNKYYKRYSARVKVRQIKEADFKKWKYQAMSKRDECTDGIITPEEFTEWMENSFPNRKPKNLNNAKKSLLYRNSSWDERLQYQNGIILNF